MLTYNHGDRLVAMLVPARLKERLAAAGLSQAELARRINVSQAAIQKLTSGGAYGSKHLHRIARELGTTADYLNGETDDPLSEAPRPELSAEERRLLRIYRELPKKDRSALKLLLDRMITDEAKNK